MSEIKVIVIEGLNEYSIEFIQEIEKVVDAALLQVGFSRTGTEKYDELICMKYWQFAVCK